MQLKDALLHDKHGTEVALSFLGQRVCIKPGTDNYS